MDSKDRVALSAIVFCFGVLMVGVCVGSFAESHTRTTVTNVDVGQKCATVLDSCMSTLKTCTEALQKGVAK